MANDRPGGSDHFCDYLIQEEVWSKFNRDRDSGTDRFLAFGQYVGVRNTLVTKMEAVKAHGRR